MARSRINLLTTVGEPMYFRSILSGTLALFLVSGVVAHADERVGIFNVFKSESASESRSVPTLGLPKLFGKNEASGETVQLAQAGDQRVNALEEQVRSLSGTIEELNFQILQMQEQLRKMQEDNEFRFQELEQKRTDSGKRTEDNSVASVPTTPPAARNQASDEGNQQLSGAPMEPEIIIDNGTGDPGAVVPGSGPGEPPTNFGTITFDDKGNVTGGSVGNQTTQSVPADAGSEPPVRQALPAPAVPQAQSETRMAALPSTDDPEELYRNSYEFILSGDYGTAEQGFRDHIDRFPSDQKAADAHFWLGEAQLGQKKYRDAAETFLAANKQYPSSKKAPDMLLKLGISLVGLDQRDVACATFAEVGKRYPDISGALKQRIKQEQALASC